MAVSIKKIRGRRYAYSAVRDGKRVITTYIGPAGSPEAIAATEESRSARAVPEKHKALFWDTDIDNINLRDNARYVIERVLEYGDMDAVFWICLLYTGRKILDVIETSRALSDKSRNFWRLWFGAEAA